MVILRPTNLHWIQGDADDPRDLCAHSGVEFRIGDVVLAQPSDGDWTVSASALFLLRTLSRPHPKEDEHLFPCCGHAMYEIEGSEDVAICGCPDGLAFGVERQGDEVFVTVRNQEHRIPIREWRDAVCRFSDAVQAFYDASTAKQPFEEFEAKGFARFLAEWSRRRAQAEGV